MSKDIAKLATFESQKEVVCRTEGLITEKIPYEISKSWDFAKDFRISGKISRFHERFQDFMKDFKISVKISRFH